MKIKTAGCLNINREHEGNNNEVKFSWQVIKKHNKPLQRQLHEAVKINNKKHEESLNSKNKFNGQRIRRIGLEKVKSEIIKSKYFYINRQVNIIC